jgi:hypothetical protein
MSHRWGDASDEKHSIQGSRMKVLWLKVKGVIQLYNLVYTLQFVAKE